MFERTVTMGSTSAGKRTFLIRFPLEMRTPDDSSTDEENHVHGRRPQKRKSEYGFSADRPVMTNSNTNE
jgi:hypothetical protein